MAPRCCSGRPPQQPKLGHLRPASAQGVPPLQGQPRTDAFSLGPSRRPPPTHVRPCSWDSQSPPTGRVGTATTDALAEAAPQHRVRPRRASGPIRRPGLPPRWRSPSSGRPGLAPGSPQPLQVGARRGAGGRARGPGPGARGGRRRRGEDCAPRTCWQSREAARQARCPPSPRLPGRRSGARLRTLGAAAAPRCRAGLAARPPPLAARRRSPPSSHAEHGLASALRRPHCIAVNIILSGDQYSLFV